MVSLTRELLREFSPDEILEYAISLGFQHILFERVTLDGNAKGNPEVMPDNLQLDSWMLEMYRVTEIKGYKSRINNMLLSEIEEAYYARSFIGNRCRACEQKLITINADGTISGCPNSASTAHWGKIDQDVSAFIKSPGRLKAICSEKLRNENCFKCEVKDICNGDCYKLPWQGDVCAAPKSLLKYLSGKNRHEELAR